MIRVLKWIGAGLLLVVLALVGFAWWSAVHVRKAATAAGVKADLRVLAWARFWCLAYGIPFPLYLAILGNEVASVAKNGAYPLGDVTDPKGPALGPGQVLRVNVVRLQAAAPWYVAPFVRTSSPGDLASVSHTGAAIWASVQVLRETYTATGGDWHQAARRYNGSGTRAEAYADRADATVHKLTATV